MQKLCHLIYFQVLYSTVSLCAEKLVLFSIFVSYVLSGNPLNADKVFVLMSVLNLLNFDLTYFLPNGIANLYQLAVSCGRVQKFLLLGEADSTVRDQNALPRTKNRVDLEDVQVKWNLVRSKGSGTEIDKDVTTSFYIRMTKI